MFSLTVYIILCQNYHIMDKHYCMEVLIDSSIDDEQKKLVIAIDFLKEFMF